MSIKYILGIDMGGTNIRGGLVNENDLQQISSRKINAQGSADDVLQELFNFIDGIINDSVSAIGIGVPGLVEEEHGIVFDVLNIPAWKEVPLEKYLQERYHLPVVVNNDANCFALGEFYFGKGKSSNSLVGLTIGTGLGAGLILNKKLYSGSKGGAGEFGTANYLDKSYEYYASGQYFANRYKVKGETVFAKAMAGDTVALQMYHEMGTHLGQAIKMILYALDIELIVLGGSVRQAFPFFSAAMWKSLDDFAFKRSLQQLKIEVSVLENSGILGAAALYYDKEKSS